VSGHNDSSSLVTILEARVGQAGERGLAGVPDATADTNDDGPIPGAPSDYTTITEVMAGYADAGFDGSFELLDDRLRCGQCGAEGTPSEFEMSSRRRLEGASDPDDMSAVVALACRTCGARGTMVVMFGPQASPLEGEVLAAVQAQSGEASEIPPHAAPGETVEDQP
jgi:hypothetical protein